MENLWTIGFEYLCIVSGVYMGCQNQLEQNFSSVNHNFYLLNSSFILTGKICQDEHNRAFSFATTLHTGMPCENWMCFTLFP